MSPGIVSTADVMTDRPARYGKQLVSHLGRRAGGVWDDDSQAGRIELGSAQARLSCSDGSLHLEISAEPDDVAQMEDVVGRHLVRFGQKDELVVVWNRSDGVPGTVQGRTESTASE